MYLSHYAGDFRFEASPYEDIENEDQSKSKYNKLATLASGNFPFSRRKDIGA